jgi:hypothetical protein
MPRSAAPEGLKTALLARFEQQQVVRTPSLWSYLAVPLTATSAAAVVLVAGALFRSPPTAAAEWVQIHPTTVAATAPVRVVDVDDASLDALGSAGTLIAAAPIEGP